MTQRRAYLDYNATAPLRPAAASAMREVMEGAGNPSSVHREGRKTHRIIEEARGCIAALLDCKAGEVVFTSGASEASNMVISAHDAVCKSAVEHPSVLNVPVCGGGEGFVAGVDAEGGVDLIAIEAFLKSQACVGTAQPPLVSVQGANSETGIKQSLTSVVALAREYGARVHSDCVQVVGKDVVSFRDLDVDFMSVSAHKFGGPAGVGALVKRDTIDIEPLIHGGFQEHRARAGTENVIGIAGFGAAAREVAQSLADEAARVIRLRTLLEDGVRAMTPNAIVVGARAHRLINTSCIALPGIKAETLVIALDLEGLAVSAGSACSSGKVTSSHVLTAMGLGTELAGAAIRTSLGWATADADVDQFLTTWERVVSTISQRESVA